MKRKYLFKGITTYHLELLNYQGKNPESFRKGSDSVKLFNLHPKVPAQANSSNGSEIQEPIRKVPPRVKVMTMFKMTEKVKSDSRKLALQGELSSKQGNRVNNTIRIQIEEIKRKVRIISPEALLFIGPGDHESTLNRERREK